MSVVTGISGQYISAKYGPTNSADVSAIASAYQVVSSVGDDGTYITSINGSALSGAGGGGGGSYVETSAMSVNIGSGNTADPDVTTAFIQGDNNYCGARSLVQGSENYAYGNSLAQGNANTAMSFSLSQGYGNSATTYALAQGGWCTADRFSIAQGEHVSAYNTAAVFGTYNLKGDGSTTADSAMFVIGDGEYEAPHDLMVVTRDGEITMYSSTADTAGTGIMSSLRAISAAATGGGGGVVTATGSASATAGWFPWTTSYLVSSINGSAILPYGYSSLSANSANWNSAYSLISGVTALMDAI